VYCGIAAVEECASEPPPQITAPDGTVWKTGDCWCTLDDGHDGLCLCEPCTKRFGAPGWTPVCTSSISDGIETVTCAIRAGHDGDHGRGFLRWDDDGQRYTQRQRAEDGTWHALPYPEGKPW
jgi:hypothetical protein